jgi:hypothetical protein
MLLADNFRIVQFRLASMLEWADFLNPKFRSFFAYLTQTKIITGSIYSTAIDQCCISAFSIFTRNRNKTRAFFVAKKDVLG